MGVVNNLLSFIVKMLSKLLPALHVPVNFINAVDSCFAFFIKFFGIASFFIPLDVLVMCLGVILLIDNFALISRVVQYILKLIRG